MKTPFSTAEFIKAHSLGNPESVPLQQEVAKQLRAAEYRSVVRSKKRVWVTLAECGAVTNATREAIATAIKSGAAA
jgi:hypothetical protein